MLRNLVLLVFSAILVACAEAKEVTADQLFERDGIIYETFSSEPFTGRVSGSGELRFGAYKNGMKTGPWETYHENGQLSGRWEYVAGELDGMSETYYENGQLMGRGEFIKDGILYGVWERYYENGQLESRKYFNGKKKGSFENYYENGQLESRGEYVNGKKNGIWETYSADGMLELREVWEDGELVSSTGEDD